VPVFIIIIVASLGVALRFNLRSGGCFLFFPSAFTEAQELLDGLMHIPLLLRDCWWSSRI
jgi:hypothetical protein